MEKMEKMEKMIETLVKFARDGKETATSNRLFHALTRVAKESKHVSGNMLEMLCKKQSMDSCLVAATKVLDLIAANKAAKREQVAQVRAAAVAELPEKKVVRGYYTNDICQSWVSENDPEFDLAEYESFQRCCRLARRGRL